MNTIEYATFRYGTVEVENGATSVDNCLITVIYHGDT